MVAWGTSGQTATIRAVVRHLGFWGAARTSAIVGASDAIFVAANRDLSTAVGMEAGIAAPATILVCAIEVDPFAVRSPARAAGAAS